MDLLLLLIIFLPPLVSSGRLNPQFIYPNFTASGFQFIDNDGAFLVSRNGTFKATITNPGSQSTNFYFCVLHVASNTITWSANRGSPISNSGTLTLTVAGITIVDEKGVKKWSTPALKSAVTALQLTETGNLVLLDKLNVSLWESFNNPTDTIIAGQRLPVGFSLDSAISDTDLSTGNYRFSVTTGDAVLQWKGLTYWRLAMDAKAYQNSNFPATYMSLNDTGLYLFSDNGSNVVIQVSLSSSPTKFRIAKLTSEGRFSIRSFSGGAWTNEFVGPFNDCRIPSFCSKIGLCTNNAGSNSGICSCPSGFHASPQNNKDCLPVDGSYSLATGCDSTGNGSQSPEFSYLRLGYDVDYFANYFMPPAKDGLDLLGCKNICSKNCSCLGIFHANASGSCYLIENQLGSFMLSTDGQNDRLGYVKTVYSSPPTNQSDGNVNSNGDKGKGFPIAASVLIPSTGFFLFATLLVMVFLWRRRRTKSQTAVVKLGRPDSSSSMELETISIPGLPVRFDYEELETATEKFSTLIGSGGFGSVYRGTFPDKTLVAVKKVMNLGVHGKKEFCTEIAVIGNVRHVNLVRLKGFCAQGRQRLLVYEYMNRGSLERTLFGDGPVLEWQERFEIALGTARGLAYLHSGCGHKIIHCDVKPENILLHDHFQVKISDFGLSKLLSPEQSSWFTTMRGTRGYLAPEWLTSSGISDKTDVYSYGMVLLEIVRGRKNCYPRLQTHSTEDGISNGDQSLSSSSASESVYFPLFALEMHEQGKYLGLEDPRLEGRVTSNEVEKLVRVALCCVHEEPNLRPNMVTVVGMLEGGIPLSEPRVSSLNFLQFYGRRFAEAHTLEGSHRQSDFMVFPQANTSHTSTTNGSHASLSYISSQQVSGPR